MSRHTRDIRRPDVRMAQEALLDDPGFLREIVQRVIQEILEAEMTETKGRGPLRAHRRPQSPPQRLQA
jgi:transposase-like protein